MPSVTPFAPPLASTSPRGDVRRNRALLALLTLGAVAFGIGLGPRSAPVEPDLARLLRYMALLKGVFALAALAVCWWRLARPAAVWREAVYVAAPGLAAGGALCLWQLQAPWLATVGLHAGLFALLAAALSDDAFVSLTKRPPHRRARKENARRSGVS